MPEPLPTADQVRRYLAAHPEFAASVRDEGPNVIDFGGAALGQLKARVAALDASQRDVLDAARGTRSLTERVHVAALAALDAPTLAVLIHVVTADWVDQLGMDCIVLAQEAGTDIVRFTVGGAQLAEVQTLPDAAVTLQTVAQGDALFGPAADLIGWQAFVRLSPPAPLPHGVLALGARSAAGLERAQTSAALAFLGAVLERCLARFWLAAP
jgi:uncharacterized protein